MTERWNYNVTEELKDNMVEYEIYIENDGMIDRWKNTKLKWNNGKNGINELRLTKWGNGRTMKW